MALTKITTSVVAVNSLTTANIADNSIDATKIASNSILTRHIDDAQITTDQILDGTIATADIADDAVTEDKLANAINTSIAAKLPLAGGTLTGAVNITGAISSGADTTIATFGRAGGAVSSSIIYADATTDMEFGTTTAHALSLITSDTRRLTITGSGNVGIGESNPDAPLHITSNTPIISFDESDASQEFRLGSFGGAFALYDSTDSAYRLIVDGSGKVGIGRTDPTQVLEVHKATGGDQTVAKFSAHNYGDTGKTFIELGTEYGDGSSRIGSFNDTGNKSVLVFDTHSATSGQFTERMRIDSSGNVSMGRSFTSGANLHVEDTSDSMLLIYETGTSPYTATLKLASQSMASYGSNVQYTSQEERLTIENYGRALSAGSASGGIRFRTKVGNGSLSEVMIINGHEGTITQPHQTFFMTNRAAGNQTFANAAWVDIDWTGEPYDTGGNYVLSSGVFTAPIAGVYLFTGLIGFNTIAATNYVLARIVCSSAGDFYTTHEQKRDGGGDYGYDHAISQMIYLAASETVKMQVFAGSGGDHSIGSRSNWQGRLLG